MPKNKGKGGKNRRRGKNEGEEKRELITKDEGQGESGGRRRSARMEASGDGGSIVVISLLYC